MGIERRTIYFSGTVQGVGFRMTAVQLSRGLHLAGTVKNLSDGRVELIVEGTGEEISKLLIRLREHFGGLIRLIEQTSGTPKGLQGSIEVVF